jgi:hypothetical protein
MHHSLERSSLVRTMYVIKYLCGPATGLWSHTDSTSGRPQRYYRAFTR